MMTVADRPDRQAGRTPDTTAPDSAAFPGSRCPAQDG